MRSIALPFRISNGRVATLTDQFDIVEQKILDVMLTSNRERVMNPRYGSSVYSLLYEMVDDNVLADFKTETLMDLRENVGGVEIIDIKFNSSNLYGDSEYNTTLEVSVYYRIPPSLSRSVTFSVSG